MLRMSFTILKALCRCVRKSGTCVSGAGRRGEQLFANLRRRLPINDPYEARQ